MKKSSFPKKSSSYGRLQTTPKSKGQEIPNKVPVRIRAKNPRCRFIQRISTSAKQVKTENFSKTQYHHELRQVRKNHVREVCQSYWLYQLKRTRFEAVKLLHDQIRRVEYEEYRDTEDSSTDGDDNNDQEPTSFGRKENYTQ